MSARRIQEFLGGSFPTRLRHAGADSAEHSHPNLQTPASIAILRPMQPQAATFDTHAFVKRLTGAGRPESQFEFTLNHEFEKFRAELKYELNATEHRLTIKLGAIIIIGLTVLKAALA